MSESDGQTRLWRLARCLIPRALQQADRPTGDRGRKADCARLRT